MVAVAAATTTSAITIHSIHWKLQTVYHIYRQISSEKADKWIVFKTNCHCPTKPASFRYTDLN